MKMTVAVLDKSDGNAAKMVADVLAEMVPETNMQFCLAMPSNATAGKNPEPFKGQKLNSPIAIGSTSPMAGTSEQVILMLENASLTLEGGVYFPEPTPSVAKVVASKIQLPDYKKSAAAFLRTVEGDFALFIASSESIVAARDPVGVQPLYFGENQAVAALATNRKTLWKLGIEETKSFPPGHTAAVTKHGFEFKAVKVLEPEQAKPTSMQEATVTLLRLLRRSMRLRVYGQNEVAVAFSGGLDSSVVACLAKEAGTNVCLIHVSLRDRPETEEAKKAAEALGMPIQVHLFTESDVENVASKVVELIEEPDPIKAAVGVPFFWNAQKAAAAGYRVLMAGQGADELFGGYKRYVTEYLAKGDEAVRQTMFHDVAVIHESNIERDEKICNYHNVELRLPFASGQIAKFAMSLPTELKFEKTPDSLRKLVLRKTAEKMGIPKEIAQKPKKAVQYSTGINNAIKRIAKKHGLTLAEYTKQLFQQTKNNPKKS